MFRYELYLFVKIREIFHPKKEIFYPPASPSKNSNRWSFARPPDKGSKSQVLKPHPLPFQEYQTDRGKQRSQDSNQHSNMEWRQHKQRLKQLQHNACPLTQTLNPKDFTGTTAMLWHFIYIDILSRLLY